MAAHLESSQEVDRRCDAFEAAWQAGQQPDMAGYVEGVAQAIRPQLVCRLLAIELKYRRNDQGEIPTDQELLALHLSLREDLVRALANLRETIDSPTAAFQESAPKDQFETTLGRPRHGVDADGLHIRCPHCNNAVELLAESAVDDDVTCRSCGSMFSLIDDREAGGPGTSHGKRLGRFELIRHLGIGSFGSVWKARDAELDRHVAIKIPRRGGVSRAEQELFLREARTVAQLRHPNIVPIHEIGRDFAEGTIYIVSELIHGQSLMDWLEDRRLNAQEIAELGSTIADALHHAHVQGVIHRDLKPSNVMIDVLNTPYVMDFGLAKREVGEVTMTMEGNIIGTPAYMSPEQARGEGHWTDRRTDIYSLGVMLYEMATGELPYRGNAQMQLQEKLISDAPDPRRLNRHLPPDFATIVLKCMERDPNQRYATAKAVADELRRFLRGEPVHARPISRTERTLRWCKRYPLAAATIALGGFLAVAGPIAAVVISAQKAEILARHNENRDMKDAAVAERNMLGQKNSELQKRIAALEGGDPGLARTVPSWKKTLVESLVDRHYDSTLASMPSPEEQPYRAAQVHLALAVMLQAVERREQAIQHFESASQLLANLDERGDRDESIQAALADAAAQLAEMHWAEGHHDESQRWTDEALLLRQRLAAAKSDAAQSHVNHLSAVLGAAGKTEQASLRRDRLLQSQQLSEKVHATWPTDPAAIYQLANFLTHREAVLPGEPTKQP